MSKTTLETLNARLSREGLLVSVLAGKYVVHPMGRPVAAQPEWTHCDTIAEAREMARDLIERRARGC